MISLLFTVDPKTVSRQPVYFQISADICVALKSPAVDT